MPDNARSVDALASAGMGVRGLLRSARVYIGGVLQFPITGKGFFQEYGGCLAAVVYPV